MKEFIEFLSNSDWLHPVAKVAIVVGVILALPLLARLDTVYQVFEKFRNLRAKELTDLVGLTHITEKTRAIVTDEIDRHVFSKLTKLDLSSSCREAVHLAVTSSDGTVNYRDFRRAHSYVHVGNGQVAVKVGWFDKAFFYTFRFYAGIVFLIAALIGVTMITQLFVRAEPGVDHYLTFSRQLGAFVVTLTLSILVALTTRPIAHAKELAKKLASIETQVNGNQSESKNVIEMSTASAPSQLDSGRDGVHRSG